MKLQGKAEEEQRISPVPTSVRLTDSTKLAALSATGQHIYFRWMDSSSVFVSPTTVVVSADSVATATASADDSDSDDAPPSSGSSSLQSDPQQS